MPGHSRNARQGQIAYLTEVANLADLVIPGKSSGNYLTKSVYSEGKIGVILKSCNNDLCLLSFIYPSFISTKDKRKLENIFIFGGRGSMSSACIVVKRFLNTAGSWLPEKSWENPGN